MKSLCLALFAVGCAAHDGLPVNPLLNVPGYPDCTQPVKGGDEFTLECTQRPKDRADQLLVGCVGDSITAGSHSTGGNHTYPGQLQIMLGDGYKVTNLGACGSTMLKKGNSPYWERPQYTTLTENKWDIIIIMLGTNDAKDVGSHGHANWPHNCTGPTGLECPFAQDYASMIDVVRTLGTTEDGPVIYSAIPPPLMEDTVYGMNQTVINTVFPTLIPQINTNNSLPHAAIDVFHYMGGAKHASFPPGGCTLNTTSIPDCKYWCDAQSCDQCHPNNNGYTLLAEAMYKGLGSP